MAAERIREYLMTHGVEYDFHEHELAYTAQEVAAVEHIPGDEFAKPVMLFADGTLTMAVLPATQRVDLDKARSAMGAQEIRLANEDEFKDVFVDCQAGAEPPFGNFYGVPVYVDESLTAERITFNAGTHTQCITMALADYVELVKPYKVTVAA
jgi:Ala-tRNA(Pro) deacylase